MKPKSEKSMELYHIMLRRGYLELYHAEEGTGEHQCKVE
jgi:hypothetical protein